MQFEWDDDKNAANLAKHGVSFEAIYRFDWDVAIFEEDTRTSYGEMRQVSQSFIDGRLHILIFTMRGDIMRIIVR
jgi:uncharacterized protein